MTSPSHAVFAVIGGGAAGFFGAINLARLRPDAQVILFEKSGRVLQKVLVSGGGRCNVTHACFDPRELSHFYPRGSRELIGPFNRFQPGDMMGWLADRGVETKVEDDNRVFPITNNSRTIADCLQAAALEYGVEVRTSDGLRSLNLLDDGNWQLETDSETLRAEAVLMATGSSKAAWKMLEKLGLQITDLAPSLFTFNIKDPRIDGLSGLATPAAVKVVNSKLEEYGPVLITHWGLSGPGILKLSAWGARELAKKSYRFEIIINWNGQNADQNLSDLYTLKDQQPRQLCGAERQFEIPKRLWQRLTLAAGIEPQQSWAETSKAQLRKLAEEISQGRFSVNGKSTFKEEFVTCGGVDLKEVNFKTMESKRLAGLYFAGEMLDIDAITGGFNFQAAWTTSWIAAHAMAGQE